MQWTTSLGATAVNILFEYASHIKKPRISAKKKGNLKKKVIKEGNLKKKKIRWPEKIETGSKTASMFASILD